jgi:ankyrin repeat protein
MPQVQCLQTVQRELADSIIRLAPLDEIRIVLACGAKVNEPVTQGLRPLHYAVYQGYLEAARLILVRGGDVDARDDVGYTALHLCAERGYIEGLQLVLQHGARVDWSDRQGGDPYPRTVLADEPLRLAIKNGHYDAVKLLLQHGANASARYFLGAEINLVHPLNVPILEILLAYGAYADSRDRGGLTPLMKACRHPEGLESALLLISYGADVKAMTSERHDFRTVLHYAVLSGNKQIVNLLLKQGAPVNFPSDYRKPTPLDFAILKGNTEMVKQLLEAGADVNANSPLIGSPLHIACSDNIENRLDILRLLLDNGADPNLYTESETGPLLKTPLGEYINFNVQPDVRVVELLLRYGANVVLKTQYHDPMGILKSLPKLAECPDVFHMVVDAAEKFNVGIIQRSPSFSAAQKQILLSAAKTPLPLKHQLRLFIRRHLGRHSLPLRIQQLPFPPLIKSYLLYEI